MSLPSPCWCGGKVTAIHLDLVCNESAYHDPATDGRKSSIDRLYVAGPMSGYPENNYPEFNRAANTLRELGYGVVNPAEYGAPKGKRVHYVDLLREDLRHMLDCDGVAVLENWWESAGARNEVQVAGLLKMPVRTVSEWINRKVHDGNHK